MKKKISNLKQKDHLLKRKLFTFVVFLILVGILSNLVSSSYQEETDDLDTPNPVLSVSHSPIYIDGNAALDVFARELERTVNRGLPLM